MTKLFDDRQFYGSLLAISVPIMLQNFINSAVNMLDTVMIGRLGAVEIAAVGLGNQVFFLYNMTLFGICSGGAIFTAQFWGKRDIKGIRKNMGFCLCLAVLLGAVFTFVCGAFPHFVIGIYSRDPAVIAAGGAYLRALSPSFIPFAIDVVFILTLRSVEKVRLAIVATVIALSMNAALNWLLIFGHGPFPRLGVEGAAIATVISRFTEAGIVVAVTYARKYVPAARAPELFAFNLNYARRFFVITIPVILNELVWSAGVTMQSLIFARTDTNAIAAFNITNTFSQLTWVIFIGLGNGVAVLIGKKIGEGNNATARDYASRIIRFSPLVAVFAAALLFPASRFLPFIFNVGEAVISAATDLFLILCLSYPFRAFNMAMVVGVCRAGGDTLFCMFYDVAFMWLLALPAAAVSTFVFGAPVWVIYLCLSIEDPIKATLGLWRYKTGRWLHSVTENL